MRARVNLLQALQLGWRSCGWKVGSDLSLGPPIPSQRENGAERGWEHSGPREAADLQLLFAWAPGCWTGGWAAVTVALYPCCLIQNISCLYFEMFEARIVGGGWGKSNG